MNADRPRIEAAYKETQLGIYDTRDWNDIRAWEEKLGKLLNSRKSSACPNCSTCVLRKRMRNTKNGSLKNTLNTPIIFSLGRLTNRSCYVVNTLSAEEAREEMPMSLVFSARQPII
jgi:hypothetical protein